MNEIYERYCKRRDELGFRDADVAKGTGITKSTFSEWKKGGSQPNADKLLKISGFLNTTVEYLMTGAQPSLPERLLKNPRVLELSKELLKNPALLELAFLEKDLGPKELEALRVMAATLAGRQE